MGEILLKELLSKSADEGSSKEQTHRTRIDSWMVLRTTTSCLHAGDPGKREPEN
jgi:hypothetical protein